MAEEDRRPEERGPSLELPSLRTAFRGRRNRTPPTEAAPGPQEHQERPADTATTVLPRPARLAWLRRLRRPRNPIAAVVAGAAAGLVLVGGTWAAMHLCTVVRGTSSCGLPGVGLLLLIVVVAATVGSLVLGYLGVATHGSAGTLGTGLTVVVVLLALLPYDDRWWMVVVVPVIAMAAFVGAWWLTATYVEPGDRPR